jgi:hypothetical protein
MAIHTIHVLGPLGLALGFTLGMGCRSLATHHCGNHDGDATCAERGTGRFCDYCRADDDGCTDVRPSEECHFAGSEPAASSSGTTDDAISYGEVTRGEEGPGTTGPTSCTTDEECDDPSAPFCEPDRGECVACDELALPDAACAGRDATMPLCVDGECVQCSAASAEACDPQLWICDAEAHACTPCTEHAQCESHACELARGRCFGPDVLVLEVDGDGGADHPSVSSALVAIADGGMGIIRVHERSGGAAYEEIPVVGDGKTVALVAAPGESPVLRTPLASTAALRVTGPDTTVYVDRLTLADSALGRGLIVGEGTVWVDRSRIVRNGAGGVLAQAGADITIRSSFVGGSIDDVAAVEVTGATARILYSTLGGGSLVAHALVCDATATVDVRNSVLVAEAASPEVECDGTFVHDAAELDLGVASTAVGPMSTAWFADYLLGDLSLTATGAHVFADVARWQRGDPRTDIDGDPRPAVHESLDHAGADVP